METNKTQTAVQRLDKHEVEYVPFGQTLDNKIKLTVGIVKNLLAVPTRSGKTCSDRDALKFIMLCFGMRLNPFAGDAYLYGFDKKDGSFVHTLVVSHQAYLKRSVASEDYDGMKSGLVIRTEDGDKEIETEILPEGAKLVGGWAEIWLKNRKTPTKKIIPLTRFAPMIERHQQYGGTWKDDPGGMIVKCAEADAMRSSFPNALGGLYMRDEAEAFAQITSAPDLGSAAASLVDVKPAPALPPAENIPSIARDDLPMGQESPKEEKTSSSVQDQLACAVIEAGHDFETFKAWGVECGQLQAPDNVNSFAEVPAAEARRILRLKKLMLEAMARAKGGA